MRMKQKKNLIISQKKKTQDTKNKVLRRKIIPTIDYFFGLITTAHIELETVF